MGRLTLRRQLVEPVKPVELSLKDTSRVGGLWRMHLAQSGKRSPATWRMPMEALGEYVYIIPYGLLEVGDSFKVGGSPPWLPGKTVVYTATHRKNEDAQGLQLWHRGTPFVVPLDEDSTAFTDLDTWRFRVHD